MTGVWPTTVMQINRDLTISGFGKFLQAQTLNTLGEKKAIFPTKLKRVADRE